MAEGVAGATEAKDRMNRPFRFGAQLYGDENRGKWLARVRKAESIGYAVVTMPDHFGQRVAIWPSIVAAADATTSLRFGSMTINNDLWNPVMLAREAATTDVLTEGRLELGLGAGWRVVDYEWTGIPRDRASVRVARLAESVEVLKKAFAGRHFDFHGQYFHVDGVEGWPHPVQQPHPPLMIGGSGPKILGLAAREADIVGVHINLDATVVIGAGAQDAKQGATDRQISDRLGWIKDAARDRFNSLELHLFLLEVAITDDRSGMAQTIADAYAIGPEEVKTSPYFAVGTVENIVRQLQESRERYGLSYFTAREDHLELFAPVVERLAGQ
jgi:probable F420-dependent oxidoreductase